jgi:hypothetical protein
MKHNSLVHEEIGEVNVDTYVGMPVDIYLGRIKESVDCTLDERKKKGFDYFGVILVSGRGRELLIYGYRNRTLKEIVAEKKRRKHEAKKRRRRRQKLESES